MAFPKNEINNFVLGSEDGNVYSGKHRSPFFILCEKWTAHSNTILRLILIGCRHGTRPGIIDAYEKHLAPVTGISTHYNQSSPDFGHLFLTSSIDWTIKLWSLKENKPLYSFEDNSDYVCDVAWSPIHPALFASVDGQGRLDLWNLNQDTEVPTASVVIDGAPALNRVSWTPSGLHVTIGDDFGKIYVYDVAEHLATPRMDEWTKFAATLNELKMNQTDDFESIEKKTPIPQPSSLSAVSGPESLISNKSFV